ncbi:uncharacterized protein AMSG_01172 [Thecamonas trahens ATCC 50062]|uniref:Uncharacterized protein n=1 Tax=Thecamonas trahens ATCC 50062 TaxID=461836 RepID=A0A0L0DMB1_THETB|nr:hypothetical protein AMSG_01172 [Thecamonas trahens ATCC 50062]KNC53459.1 hypothetical protein AMSG_01172 [Thecamonas trahens ATCC 50062]|eukprot:XP_013761783.1 hypothetical protein AMSG_01172 [Thecamonas trahens ATCC 50062]
MEVLVRFFRRFGSRAASGSYFVNDDNDAPEAHEAHETPATSEASETLEASGTPEAPETGAAGDGTDFDGLDRPTAATSSAKARKMAASEPVLVGVETALHVISRLVDELDALVVVDGVDGRASSLDETAEPRAKLESLEEWRRVWSAGPAAALGTFQQALATVAVPLDKFRILLNENSSPHASSPDCEHDQVAEAVVTTRIVPLLVALISRLAYLPIPLADWPAIIAAFNGAELKEPGPLPSPMPASFSLRLITEILMASAAREPAPSSPPSPAPSPPSPLTTTTILETYASHVSIVLAAASILKELGYRRGGILVGMAENDEFVSALFVNLGEPVLFETVVALLEDVLSMRRSLFDLTMVPGLAGIVAGFTPRRLAVFSRILAFLLEKPSIRFGVEPEDALSARLSTASMRQSSLAYAATATTLAHNVAFVLGVPNLVERFVALLKIPVDFHTHSTLLASINPTPMVYQLMARVADRSTFGGLQQVLERVPAAVVAGTSSLQTTTFAEVQNMLGAVLRFPPVISMLELIVLAISGSRSEILYTLTCALASSRQAPLVERLMECGGLSVLAELVESLRNDPDGRHQFLRSTDANHASHAPCSIMSQTLRALYNAAGVVTRPQVRLLLLSMPLPHTLAELIVSADDDAHVVMPACAALEVMFRYTHKPEVVNALASEALIARLVQLTRVPSISLSAFDLLGSIVHGNADGLARVEDALKRARTSASEFMRDVVATDLVASNVFVRHILALSKTDGRAAAWVAPLQPTLLSAVLDALDIHAMSSDNLCCLNTLVLASCDLSDGELAATLASLDAAGVDKLRRLIDFFPVYYEARRQERASLALSSQVSWRKWQLSVARLDAALSKRCVTE